MNCLFHIILIVDSRLLAQKQTAKINKEKIPPEAELYESILRSSISNEEYLQVFNVNTSISTETTDNSTTDSNNIIKSKVNKYLYLVRFEAKNTEGSIWLNFRYLSS